MEFKIKDNCDFSDFYSLVDIIEKLGYIIEEKVTGFDSVYYDFNYKGVMLTIHYNVFLGVVLYPKKMNDATVRDNELAHELSNILVKRD